jgi:alanine racemase
VTVRLTVREDAWRAHLRDVAASTTGLIPVIKGNGYGFGRATLAPIAAQFAAEIAVGTVYELSDVPPDRTPHVLTPTLTLPTGLSTDVVLSVGSFSHLEPLAGWHGRVTIKLVSSMLRFGVWPNDLGALLDACRAMGVTVVGFMLHLPLAGSDDDRLAEASRWLPLLPVGEHAATPLSVSHLSPDAQARLAELAARAGGRTIRTRVGTALRHGDKSTLHLGADVVEVRTVTGGTTAGYRATPVGGDGHLVVVGAGSAHGVAALPNGASPFHFARRRMTMFEPPHMHSTMLFVADGDPLPAVGEVVDLQRPLTTTAVDEVIWQ